MSHNTLGKNALRTLLLYYQVLFIKSLGKFYLVIFLMNMSFYLAPTVNFVTKNVSFYISAQIRV